MSVFKGMDGGGSVPEGCDDIKWRSLQYQVHSFAWVEKLTVSALCEVKELPGLEYFLATAAVLSRSLKWAVLLCMRHTV